MGTLNLGKLHGVTRTAEGPGVACAVTVYPAGSVNEDGSLIGSPVAATLYLDQDGGTTTANPLTTDAVGRFACYLAPGAYDLRFAGAAITPRGVQNVQVLAGISAMGQAATLPGMARSYVVADATARAALAKVVAGDLAYQQDTDCLYHYTGSVWELVRGAPPVDYRVPLLAGVVRSTNETSWTELSPCYWNSQNPPNLNALPWGDGEGAAFNKAWVPAGAAIRFGGVGAICPGGGTSYELKLYDATAAAEVVGSTLTFTSNLSHYLESADITSALASGERKLRVQCRATGGYGAASAAFLRVVRE